MCIVNITSHYLILYTHINLINLAGITSSVPISHGEITEMTDAVGFYGITDLKEILSILTTSPRATLEQTRPLKLQHWIKVIVSLPAYCLIKYCQTFPQICSLQFEQLSQVFLCSEISSYVSKLIVCNIALEILASISYLML